MDTSLSLIPAPVPNASKQELGEWLEYMGAGASILARIHIEAAIGDQDQHAADVATQLASDLGSIVVALGRHIAGSKLLLAEEEFGIDAYDRIADMARALSKPLDGDSGYFDFAIEGIAERLVREIGILDQNAAEARA